MSDPAYQVHLPIFEGPLDLLLQLIEREKLDISAVSLAQVADQFLVHVRNLEQIASPALPGIASPAFPGIEAGALADFLVVAAKLVWIKSRLLLPQPKAAAEEPEEDPGEALARQLREYRRFKEAAQALRAIEEAGLHTYARVAPPPDLEPRLTGGDLTLADLLAAAGRAFASLPLLPVVPPGVVVPFTLTIADQIHLIRRATAGGSAVTFRALLSGARHRLEVIVTLLAVLELIKRGQMRVTQSDLFGEIFIAPVEGVEVADDEAAPETDEEA